MSKARDHFENAIQDAERILQAYDHLNQIEGREREPEELKRAALIMTLTAWETYVEDVIEERLTADLRVIKNSPAANFMTSTLENELKWFNTPNSRNTKGMFERFLQQDVTEKWTWIDGDADQARSKLNQWIKKRGEAVHRSINDTQATHLVSRPDMKKCLTFFKKLVETTDLAIDQA
jgi:hypothetical protein